MSNEMEMISTVKNTAHMDHIAEMLEFGLSHGSHSDVIVYVSDTKKTIRCHKSVLSSASPWMTILLGERPPDETVHLRLCETSYREAMSMLNLVYTGSVNINTRDLLEGTQAAVAMLKLPILNQKSLSTASIAEPIRKKYKKKIKPQVDHRAIAKRPLMMKMGGIQPVFFVLPVGVPPGGKIPENVNSPLLPSIKNGLQQGSNPDLERGDLVIGSGNNSYQRAKSRDAEKFRCDVPHCLRGFPLACLLKRHKMIHSDRKPFSCRFCDKSFTTKAAWQHHEFARHLEDKAAKIKRDNELARRLQQAQVPLSHQKSIQVQGISDKISGGQVVQKGEHLEVQTAGRQSEQVQVIDVQDITQQISVQIGETTIKKDAHGLEGDGGHELIVARELTVAGEDSMQHHSFTDDSGTIIEVVETDSLHPTDTGVVTMDTDTGLTMDTDTGGLAMDADNPRQYITYSTSSNTNQFQTSSYTNQVAYIQNGTQFFI